MNCSLSYDYQDKEKKLHFTNDDDSKLLDLVKWSITLEYFPSVKRALIACEPLISILNDRS